MEESAMIDTVTGNALAHPWATNISISMRD